MQSFINQVNAQSKKKISSSQAKSLSAAATQIKTVITGAPAATSQTKR
jgi:hypothetical protein